MGKVGYQMGRFRVFMPRSSRFPVWPQHLSRFVGEGFIPPAGVCGGAGCGGMRASRPTVVPYVPHQPGAPRVSDARNLCRGGFISARFAAARGSRADIESAPTWVCNHARYAFSRWPRRLSRFVGEGFTAPAGAFRRPTAAQRRLLGRRSLPRALAAARGAAG